MMDQRGTIVCLPCIDTPEMAELRRRELSIPYHLGAQYGLEAVEAANHGYYLNAQGDRVEWARLVRHARRSKQSIPPEAPVQLPETSHFRTTNVQVTNETTLGASRRLIALGQKPIALNFANGVVPGGGFLGGARAQEEALCRSSALYETLVDDPMYDSHQKRDLPDSTDWIIYSPDVPIFRSDDGRPLDEPWLLSFLTCAAPYVPEVGQPLSGDLLQRRIHRVLKVANSLGYRSLVLGAWGCGAFENDPYRTAIDFRAAFENQFSGAFSDVVFAIADWSDFSDRFEMFSQKVRRLE